MKIGKLIVFGIVILGLSACNKDAVAHTTGAPHSHGNEVAHITGAPHSHGDRVAVKDKKIKSTK
jgi:hypothetical protein